jgi:molecular chaperone GrpE
MHQAIERVESPDFTPGLIISEMLRGYTLKERLLRPALVVVSRGSSSAAGEAEQNQSGNGSGGAGDMSEPAEGQ